MSDNELLELAAKAAGIDAKFFTHADGSVGGPFIGNSGWNPITDDGDALRLAVKLHLLGRKSLTSGEQWRVDYFANGCDELEATRRAIVRAAAEIGKTR